MSRIVQARATLSRGEVEGLCVLHVVGRAGCRTAQVARRLGLSDSLAAAVAEGAMPLVQAGLLEWDDDRFTVTEAGSAHLAARLKALGVAA